MTAAAEDISKFTWLLPALLFVHLAIPNLPITIYLLESAAGSGVLKDNRY
jgi:hypothetical protein